VLAYFNPEAYAKGDGYQFMQARLAMGSGGLTGAGLGGGHQTLGYTPEAHSDFILAPIGEEFGWLGVALVLLLFAILVWRGIRAALGARDVFGGYLAFGITLLFGVQALFNVGVVLGIVPNKGITLPLVSCGGSSLVITMFLVGLLLNVGRRPERAMRPPPPRELARRKRMRVRDRGLTWIPRRWPGPDPTTGRLVVGRRARGHVPVIAGGDRRSSSRRRDRGGAARARARAPPRVGTRGMRRACCHLGWPSRSEVSGLGRGARRGPGCSGYHARCRGAAALRREAGRGHRRRRLRVGADRADGAPRRHPDRRVRAELDPRPDQQAARARRAPRVPVVRREQAVLHAGEGDHERQPGAPRAREEAPRRRPGDR
jgi:hypothetical protein